MYRPPPSSLALDTKRSRVPSWLSASGVASETTSIRCPARRYAAPGVRNYGIGLGKTAERLGGAFELL